MQFSRFVTPKHREIAGRIATYFQADSKSPLTWKASQKTSLSEDDTKRAYVDPVLERLGFRTRSGKKDKAGFPDYYLFAEEPSSNEIKDYRHENITVVEAKRYRVDLDRGDSREEVPPKQIWRYIAENKISNPARRWGILTNGYKWRLYSIEGIEKFIEFDIEHLSESRLEELSVFVAIFGLESHLVKANGKTLLDEMREESLLSWTKVTTEIEKRGTEVLLFLINGFFNEGHDLESAKSLVPSALDRHTFGLKIRYMVTA